MAAPKNDNIKERVLISTEKLLESKSFFEITLSDIAKATKISKGTLYYYYSNKNDILFDITDRYLNSLSEALLAWLDNKSKDTSLHRYLNYTFTRGIDEQPGNLRIFLIADAISGNEHIRLKFLEKYEFFRHTFSEKIKERLAGADSDYIAWLMILLMDGLLIQNKLVNSNLDRQDFINKTIVMIKMAAGTV